MFCHIHCSVQKSSFLLIGKTSALTMNVAGVIKDWMLILLSVVLYGWVGVNGEVALRKKPLAAPCTRLARCSAPGSSPLLVVQLRGSRTHSPAV